MGWMPSCISVPLLSVNIAGTWNLFEAARECGVRRVLFASSNHVTGFYSRDERIDHLVMNAPTHAMGSAKRLVRISHA